MMIGSVMGSPRVIGVTRMRRSPDPQWLVSSQHLSKIGMRRQEICLLYRISSRR